MFTVQNHLTREVKTTVSVSAPATPAHEERGPAAHGPVQEMIVFHSANGRRRRLQVSIPVENDEVFANNNERNFHLSVRKETSRSGRRFPAALGIPLPAQCPHARFRRGGKHSALSPGDRHGEGVGYLHQFPAKLEDLQGYDVVFLGDVGVGGGMLTPENAEMLRGLVEQQASGLVFLPGQLGREKSLADSALGDLIPSRPITPKAAVSTAAPKPGSTSPSRTRPLAHHARHRSRSQRSVWRGLPGFYWYAPVVKAKPGAEVLAVHEAARNQFGRSRSSSPATPATARCSTWHRFRVALAQGRRGYLSLPVLGQVVRWMAHQRHLSQE